MANNPNPGRITAALWYFRNSCLALQPGTRDGGITVEQPGYHGTRNWMVVNRPNDYSIRYGPDKLGPGDKAAAFDWTFPDAQRGQYDTIIRYGGRVRTAHQSRDPRAYGFREVLIQADSDLSAEGYDFLLWSTRTPDGSHLWHAHFSVLRQYLNDYNAMNGMLSILAGESLETWRGGSSRYGGTEVVDMDGDQNRRLFNLEEFGSSTEDMQDDRQYLEWGRNPGDTPKTVPNKFVRAFKALQTDVAEIKAAVTAPVPVEVDATVAAAALAGNAEFLAAIAKAVADENARRQVD